MRAEDRHPIPTASWVALALALIAGVTTLAFHPWSWVWSDLALFGAGAAATIAILRSCLHRPALARFRGRPLDEGVRVEDAAHFPGYRDHAASSCPVVIHGSFRRASMATLACMALATAAVLPWIPRHDPSAPWTVQLGLPAVMLALVLGCLRPRWRVAVSRDARTLKIGRTTTHLPRPTTLRTRHISAGKKSRDVLELVGDEGHDTLLEDSVETLGALTSTAQVIADVVGDVVTVVEHVGPLPKPQARARKLPKPPPPAWEVTNIPLSKKPLPTTGDPRP